MEPFNFSQWPDDLSSKAKIKKNQVLLKDIVEFKAERESFSLKYRNNFSEEFKELNFLVSRVTKSHKFCEPKRKEDYRGISEEKK